MDRNDTNCKWCTWNSLQRLGKETGRIENQRKNQDHLDYSIVEVSQNTQKSPRDLKRLAVTQTPNADGKNSLTVNENNNNILISLN